MKYKRGDKVIFTAKNESGMPGNNTGYSGDDGIPEGLIIHGNCKQKYGTEATIVDIYNKHYVVRFIGASSNKVVQLGFEEDQIKLDMDRIAKVPDHQPDVIEPEDMIPGEVYVMKTVYEWIVLVEKHRAKRVYVSKKKGNPPETRSGGTRAWCYESIKSVRLATPEERKILLGEEEPETDPKEPLPKYWIVNVEKGEDYQAVYDYLKMKYPDKYLAAPGNNMFKYIGRAQKRRMGVGWVHKANSLSSFFSNPPLLTIDQFKRMIDYIEPVKGTSSPVAVTVKTDNAWGISNHFEGYFGTPDPRAWEVMTPKPVPVPVKTQKKNKNDISLIPVKSRR